MSRLYITGIQILYNDLDQMLMKCPSRFIECCGFVHVH